MSDEVKNLLSPITDGLTTTPRKRADITTPKLSDRILSTTSKAVLAIGRTVDSLISVFAPQTALNRIQCRQMIRSYDAAALDRTTADVDYRRTDSDSELRSRRIRLMSVSREEQRNDPFFAGGLRTNCNNVTGDDSSEEGIQIFADTGSESDNELIDSLFLEYKDKLHLRGRWHFTDMCRLSNNSLLVSGENLWIAHDIPALGSDIPFSLEDLEPDHLPTSNEMWSSGAYAPFAPIKGPNGQVSGYILDGIEYDTYRRIVAYHVLQFHPGNEFLFQPLVTKRVPIDRVIHYFEPCRPEQSRGAPYAVAGLNCIYNSNELMKSEILAERAQTSFPIHFKQIPSTLPFTTNGNNAPVYDAAGNPVEQIQTSMYTYGDSEPVMLKNDRVNSQFIPTMKFEGMRGGAAMGMSPSSYMRDSSGLNFSSLREDKMEDRRGYRFLQGLHSRYFIQKMWPMFVRALVLAGKVKIKNFDDFKRISKCEISMPEWSYVNPEQEVKADAMAVAMGQKLPSQLIGKRRFADHIKKYAEQMKVAKKAKCMFAWMEGELPGTKKSSGQDEGDSTAPIKEKKSA